MAKVERRTTRARKGKVTARAPRKKVNIRTRTRIQVRNCLLALPPERPFGDRVLVESNKSILLLLKSKKEAKENRSTSQAREQACWNWERQAGVVEPQPQPDLASSPDLESIDLSDHRTHGYGVTFEGRKADVHKTPIGASKVHSKGHVSVADSKGGNIIPYNSTLARKIQQLVQ